MVYTIYVHTSERIRSIIQKHKLEFFLQKTLEKTIRKLITLSMVLLFLTVLDSTLPTYLCSPKIAQDQFHCSCKDLQMFWKFLQRGLPFLGNEAMPILDSHN